MCSIDKFVTPLYLNFDPLVHTFVQVQCWILSYNTSLNALFLTWWCNHGNAMQMQPDARGFPVTLAHYIWDTPKQWDIITLHLIFEHAVCVRACPGVALPGHKRCINLISPPLCQVFSPTYGASAFAPLFHLLISVAWASSTPLPSLPQNPLLHPLICVICVSFPIFISVLRGSSLPVVFCFSTSNT